MDRKLKWKKKKDGFSVFLLQIQWGSSLEQRHVTRTMIQNPIVEYAIHLRPT